MYTKSLLILSIAASVSMAGNALAVNKTNPIEHAEGKVEQKLEKSAAVKKQAKQHAKNKQAKYKDANNKDSVQKKAKYNKDKYSKAKYGKDKQSKTSKQLKKAEVRQDKDHSDRVKSAGSDKAKEAQARSEDRKAIKEGYDASGEKIQGKKPWWKFWG